MEPSSPSVASMIGWATSAGRMLAIELVTDSSTKHPATVLAAEVIATARKNGVIVIKTGAAGNVVRILPPLLIDQAVLTTGTERLAAALDEICKKAAGDPRSSV